MHDMAGQDGWRIFLVDDDSDDQAILKRILSQSPYIRDIVTATSGKDLLRQLQAHHYYDDMTDGVSSLIMLDIHLPEEDGLTVLQILKNNPYTSDLPIIMITGDRATENVHQSYMLNANAFITKPATIQHLKEIHAVMEKGTAWKERVYSA
jgi:chemotaxis family two-component system response regulator Rcp1